MPTNDRLADIGQSLRFGLALANTAGQFRALGNDPTLFVARQYNFVSHRGALFVPILAYLATLSSKATSVNPRASASQPAIYSRAAIAAQKMQTGQTAQTANPRVKSMRRTYATLITRAPVAVL
jgi:hypothetical protein